MPWGFPGSTSGKEATCQCRRPKRQGFDPWVGKIPWRMAWPHTPVFLLGKNPMDRGARRATGYRVTKSQTWEKWLSIHTCGIAYEITHKCVTGNQREEEKWVRTTSKGLPQWLSSKGSACNAGDAGDMGWKYPLKEGMATHFSILAWSIPWTARHGGLQSVGSQTWTRLKQLS